MNEEVINGFESPSELRDLMGEPMDLAVRKSVSKLDKYSKEYISRSPFVCIGSADETGKADVSPRGDPPGFVQVLDDNTLFIPDRPAIEALIACRTSFRILILHFYFLFLGSMTR
jgi:predicted pyridoxine 5'-phosphate oxidase superfamily flavin-nucleotide-binding protein